MAKEFGMSIELWDRVIRIVLGIILLSGIFLLKSPWRWFGLIGLIPLATGLVGWSPLYGWFLLD
jgi:Protein of unknown function (DUF2892)